MDNKYEGKTYVEAFPIYERSILENVGIPETRQKNLYDTLDNLGNELDEISIACAYPYSKSAAFSYMHNDVRVNWWATDESRLQNAVWGKSDDEMRHLLIGASTLRAGWYTKPRIPKGKEHFFFNTTEELAPHIIGEEHLVKKALEALVATNDEHMRIRQIPLHFLGWNRDIYTYNPGSIGNKDILDSLKVTYFGEQMLDSDDPHPVGNYLANDDPVELREHFLNLALTEMEVPDARGKLFIMMDNLLGSRPNLFTKATFNRYRRLTGKPEIEGNYEEYLTQGKIDNEAFEAEEREKQAANMVVLRSKRAEVMDKAHDLISSYFNR